MRLVSMPGWTATLIALLLPLLPACNDRRGGGGHGGGDDDAGDDDDATAGSCAPEGSHTCDGTDWMACVDEEWTVEESCVDPTPLCDLQQGCVACFPGLRSCDGNTVMLCDSDGSSASPVDTCPDDAPCLGGYCQDPCGIAASQQSYFGCDFLSVTTSNNVLSAGFDQDFAVVIANPQSNDSADVTVSRNGSMVASATVAPGQTSAIMLPMVGELRLAATSELVAGGAYEVHASVPVAAYQFNPLHYLSPATLEYSFTNDASLLLPEHTLTANYMVASRPTWGVGQDDGFGGFQWLGFEGGFLTVAAVQDGTSVTVTVNGDTEGGGVGALFVGQQTTVTLNRGDVLQIISDIPDDPASQSPNYCQSLGWQQTSDANCDGAGVAPCSYCLATDADLTGSTVAATGPVAVWSGHQCSFVPYNHWACDHLEEMMFPLETWGTTVVMSAVAHPDGVGVVPTIYRVLAKDGGTQVSFDPAVRPPVTLGAGEFVEFESDQDFIIQASGPMLVTQTMEGQNALGSQAGDPAMGSGIPVAQTRADYNFLTPDTYTTNWVNVVAPAGASITLDGSPVTGFQAIGSDFAVARVPVQPGNHHIESSDNRRFGITTYGYASYTSYLYPGGLNFLR